MNRTPVRPILARVEGNHQGRLSRERTYEFVVSYIGKHGWAPTYSEIMTGTGIGSKSTVMTHLRRLELEGKLRVGRQGKSAGARMIALPKRNR